jgi:hypothetical protein
MRLSSPDRTAAKTAAVRVALSTLADETPVAEVAVAVEIGLRSGDVMGCAFPG